MVQHQHSTTHVSRTEEHQDSQQEQHVDYHIPTLKVVALQFLQHGPQQQQQDLTLEDISSLGTLDSMAVAMLIDFLNFNTLISFNGVSGIQSLG